MMVRIVLFILVSINCFFLYSTNPEQSAAVKQAIFLGEAFMAKDYEYLIDNTYKTVIEIGGGKENMIALTRMEMDKLDGEGLYVKDFRILNAEKVIKGSTEWYCVVHKYMIMESEGMTVKTNGCMIGVSENKGQDWDFVDCAGVNTDNFDLVFPNHPNKLKIPKSKEPDITFH